MLPLNMVTNCGRSSMRVCKFIGKLKPIYDFLNGNYSHLEFPKIAFWALFLYTACRWIMSDHSSVYHCFQSFRTSANFRLSRCQPPLFWISEHGTVKPILNLYEGSHQAFAEIFRRVGQWLSGWKLQQVFHLNSNWSCRYLAFPIMTVVVGHMLAESESVRLWVKPDFRLQDGGCLHHIDSRIWRF